MGKFNRMCACKTFFFENENLFLILLKIFNFYLGDGSKMLTRHVSDDEFNSLLGILIMRISFIKIVILNKEN